MDDAAAHAETANDATAQQPIADHDATDPDADSQQLIPGTEATQWDEPADSHNGPTDFRAV